MPLVIHGWKLVCIDIDKNKLDLKWNYMHGLRKTWFCLVDLLLELLIVSFDVENYHRHALF